MLSFAWLFSKTVSTDPKLPPEFLVRLKQIVPADAYESVEASMHKPKATSFRVNLLRSKRSEVLAALAGEDIIPTSINWYNDAFWVPHNQRAALLGSGPFAAQKIYVQNQSSMVPALVLAPEMGARVLDLAAAPGSKTLQIACLMAQQGEIAAVEVVKKRFFKLKDNLEKQGADNVRTFLKDGRGVWKNRPEYFDFVLLDAPCSSEGRFHVSDPETFAYWSERKIKEMARKQKRLLLSAIHATRPGGTVVYATCSFAPEENEVVVSGLLKKFEGAIEVAPLGIEIDQMVEPCMSWAGKSMDVRIAQARRILPSYHTDGFFVCKLIKTDSTLK